MYHLISNELYSYHCCTVIVIFDNAYYSTVIIYMVHLQPRSTASISDLIGRLKTQ